MEPYHKQLDKFRVDGELRRTEPLMPTSMAYDKAVYSFQAQFVNGKERSLNILEPNAICRNSPEWPHFALAFDHNSCLGFPVTKNIESFWGCGEKCEADDVLPVRTKTVFGLENGVKQITCWSGHV